MSAPRSKGTDPWPAEALWLRLQPLLPGLSLEIVPTCPSTNTVLLDRARKGALEPALLVAEQQTAGRGRQGKAWHSEPGSALLMSLALPLAPHDWQGLSLGVGVALADALEPDGLRIGLKWPNDLWLRGAPNPGCDGGSTPSQAAVDVLAKPVTPQLSVPLPPASPDAAMVYAPGSGHKLAGILIETVNVGAQRVAVIGVGINVAPLVAPPAAPATAPAAAPAFSSGRACLRELQPSATPQAVLQQVLEPLVRALLTFERDGLAPFFEAYQRRCLLRGCAISTVGAQRLEGVALGIAPDGALQVLTSGLQGKPAAVHRLSSGEVSVRPQLGAPAWEA